MVAFLAQSQPVWGAGAPAAFWAASLLRANRADKAKGSFLAVVVILSVVKEGFTL